MTALALLISDDDELIDAVFGRECDTVVGFSELFAGDIQQAHQTSWDRVVVVADSVTALRTLAPLLIAADIETKAVDLVVGGRPRPGLLTVPARTVAGRVVATAEQITVDTPARTQHVRLTLRFLRRTRLGDALAAILQSRPGRFQRPLGALRVGIVHDVPEAMAWAAGDPAAIRLDPDQPIGDADMPTVDLVLGSRDELVRHRIPVLEIAGAERRPTWHQLGTAPRETLERFVSQTHHDVLLPPVDTDVLRPIGFLVDTPSDEAWLRRTSQAGHPRLVLDGGANRASSPFYAWSGLSDRVVDQVRAYRVIHDDSSAHEGPVQQASFLVQAACAALPVVTSGLSGTVRRLLGEPLARTLTSATPDLMGDRVHREAYCMAIRRLAFERHGARRRWAGIAEGLGRPARPRPTVSVILATRRPEFLSHVAEQVTEQDWPAVELVVGLHGFARDHPRVKELEAAFTRPLVITEVPASRVLGDMLNDMCSLASGELVTKMDDDDWYSRHHVTDLVHAAEFSDADLVGSGAEFIYLETLDLTIRRHRASGHCYTSRVPGAALLLGRDTLKAIGGWRPIHRAVDTALAQTVLDSGGSIYRSHGLGIVVKRAAQGHTWDPGVEYFLRGDVDQWPGFAPPPGIVGTAPERRPLPLSWFERQRAAPETS